MSTIYTVEGNTSAGSTLVANGGGVAKKSYSSSYAKIAAIWRPKYNSGEAAAVAQKALSYVGYLEKASNSNLESFTANAGYNNYNMFAPHAKSATGSSVYTNGVSWCDIFVDDVMIRALGVTRAKKLLYDWSAYTPTSSNYLSKAGATKVTNFANAKAGDIIFFKNSTRICHTGIVVSGVTLSDGKYTAPASTSYSKADLLADVKSITGTSTASAALAKTVTLSSTKNRKHALVLPVQKYLKSLGYYTGTCDRIIGSGTAAAINKYQKNVLGYKNCDGEITAKGKMWKSFLGL